MTKTKYWKSKAEVALVSLCKVSLLYCGNVGSETLKVRGEVQFFQLQQDLNPFVRSENKVITTSKRTPFTFRVKILFSTQLQINPPCDQGV